MYFGNKTYCILVTLPYILKIAYSNLLLNTFNWPLKWVPTGVSKPQVSSRGWCNPHIYMIAISRVLYSMVPWTCGDTCGFPSLLRCSYIFWYSVFLVSEYTSISLPNFILLIWSIYPPPNQQIFDRNKERG